MKSELATPMGSSPYKTPATGGQPGDKDGLKDAVALGAPKSSTAGGPVNIQVTEDIGKMPATATMPKGTAIKA